MVYFQSEGENYWFTSVSGVLVSTFAILNECNLYSSNQTIKLYVRNEYCQYAPLPLLPLYQCLKYSFADFFSELRPLCPRMGTK